MLGVYTHNTPPVDGVDYNLIYTLNLPVDPWIKGIDVQKDVIEKINWVRPYRQWLVPTIEIISDEYQYFIKDLGLKLMSGLLLFGCQEGYKGYRHRDIHPYKRWHWGNAYNSAALNYLLTPATGSLDFWDMDEGGEIKDTETYTQYELGSEHSNSKIITSWTGQDNRAPVLVRTEAVHQAVNLIGPGPRVTLTLRFELNPIWWMVRDAFMPYTINGY
jgi:hypothetical protein